MAITITTIRQIYQATEKQPIDELTGKISWIGETKQRNGFNNQPVTVQSIGLDAPDRRGREDKEGHVFITLEGRPTLGQEWKNQTVKLTKGPEGKGLKVWVTQAGKRGVDLTSSGTLDSIQAERQHQSAPPAQQQAPPPAQQQAPPPNRPAGQGSTDYQPTNPPPQQTYEPEGYEPSEEGPYEPPSQAAPSKREQQGIALESLKGQIGRVVTVYHACREAAAYEAKCTYIKTGLLPGHYGITTSLFIDMMRKIKWDELTALPRAIDLTGQDQERVNRIMTMTPEELRDEAARQEHAYDTLAGRTGTR